MLRTFKTLVLNSLDFERLNIFFDCISVLQGVITAHRVPPSSDSRWCGRPFDIKTGKVSKTAYIIRQSEAVLVEHDLSLVEMLDNSFFLVAPYDRSPCLLTDGEIVANGAAGIQCDYNST